MGAHDSRTRALTYGFPFTRYVDDPYSSGRAETYIFWDLVYAASNTAFQIRPFCFIRLINFKFYLSSLPVICL